MKKRVIYSLHQSPLQAHASRHRRTNYKPQRPLLAYTLTRGEQLQQVDVLVDVLARDTLPVHARPQVRGEEALVEDVVRDVCHFGAYAALEMVERVELDALRHGGRADRDGVLVAHPQRERDVG